jgi:hypothetical protein
MSLEEQDKMAEQSLLVSCDCGYRDVRQGVKAHQKTCGVRIVPAQRRVNEEQEQDAAESGEIRLTSLLHPSPVLIFSFRVIFMSAVKKKSKAVSVFNWLNTAI